MQNLTVKCECCGYIGEISDDDLLWCENANCHNHNLGIENQKRTSHHDSYIIPSIRKKSKRTRIKEHRAKRNRRRFYVIIDGKQRARNTGIRRNSPNNTKK